MAGEVKEDEEKGKEEEKEDEEKGKEERGAARQYEASIGPR